MSALLRRPRLTGCQRARLDRAVREQNRAEIIDAALFPVALALAIIAWVGVCMVVR